MTGRTFIWADLLTRVWPERPILGYGFGALWMIEAFRTSMQVRHNWPYQVFFGDNGFLDFLLNLGVVGFGLFMMYFVKVGINSIKVLVRSGSFLFLIIAPDVFIRPPCKYLLFLFPGNRPVRLDSPCYGFGLVGRAKSQP